jgi:hypothetical protein
MKPAAKGYLEQFLKTEVDGVDLTLEQARMILMQLLTGAPESIKAARYPAT